MSVHQIVPDLDAFLRSLHGAAGDRVIEAKAVEVFQNGGIQLDAAHVGGGIDTVNGDITIGANSRVEGGILVEENHSWFASNSRKPRIVIGPHAVVQGTLKFKREVELWVSDSATIGAVDGASAQKFSGDRPPQ